MAESESGRARRAVGPALIAVGGVLMVFGSTITWVRYAFAQPPLALLSQSRLGVASGAGRVTIACGVVALATIPVMLAGSAAWRRGAPSPPWRWGSAGAALAVASLATKDAQVYDGIRTAIGETTGHVLTDAEFARLKTQLQATGFAISLGPGHLRRVGGGPARRGRGLADWPTARRPGPPSGSDGARRRAAAAGRAAPSLPPGTPI